MEIHFLRHGEAEEQQPGGSDADRRLTPKGEKQAQRAAEWLARHGRAPQWVVTSPYPRARQTAEAVAERLGCPLVEDRRLTAGHFDLAALRSILVELGTPETVLAVGHEPDLSEAIGQLIGGSVEMKKAALALVACPAPTRGGGLLTWLVPSAFQK